MEAPPEHEEEEPNNRFIDNDGYGLEVLSTATGSTIYAGDATYGWNRFINNDLGEVYNGLAGTTIKARGNYWGSDDFQGPGNVAYFPYWTDGANEDIREILNLFISKDFEIIPERCTQFITRYPQSESAPLVLSIWNRVLDISNNRREGVGDIHEFLENQRLGDTPLMHHSDFLRTISLIRSGEYDSAIDGLQALVRAENTPNEIRLSAYSQMSNVYLHCLDDPVGAARIYRTIIDQYPDTRQAELAAIRLERIRHQIDAMPPSQPEKERKSTPEFPHLLAAYPNPFNSSITITYIMPERDHATIRLFDLNGREIEELFDGFSDAGQHNVVWVGAGHPSGVYLCQLESAGKSTFQKLISIR